MLNVMEEKLVILVQVIVETVVGILSVNRDMERIVTPVRKTVDLVVVMVYVNQHTERIVVLVLQIVLHLFAVMVFAMEQRPVYLVLGIVYFHVFLPLLLGV
jgi:hypothetical protein